MCKPFINLGLSVVAIATLTFSPLSSAGKEDFTQAIKVDSKFQFGDGKTKKSIFREDVHINQGSLNVYADEVEVDASKGEGNEVFIATGSPAKYSQQQELGGSIEASANKIEYRRDLRTLTLEGDAQLKQNNSSVKGESITFNMELEQIVAQGEGESDGNGRVITIFQPSKKTASDNKNISQKNEASDPADQSKQDVNP
ncbi:lipopolysaccharide transport periplasmic protein LptA [Paraglaciecola sp. 20A4]|uniref:lipopolysaccharide transport periplasmic protein LptA n=1 Tax=Paraglaciecola sp. 20A4 TaxID=2687288 RepID=UPI0014085643|nr:lipopolysaccharide transport periplasmic protein LptA [Paraglaciecola sp. 20A4]